jgi:16S rRNA (adenine1518-N6/adenine1519-N6)-dimethyltransferase
VARLLDEHGLAPRKSSGQNFVVDPNTVRRIVEDARLGADDVVLEIGPGLGSLTLGLAGTARRVVAVEIDAGFVRVLSATFAGRDDVSIVHADALRSDLGAMAGGEPVRVVANLPYNIATPLVFHALEDPAVRDLYVMVQREVGERWAARVGDRAYAGVSLKLAVVAEVTIERAVPRTVFLPVPNVDSVMVRLERRADAPPPSTAARLARLADAAFAGRRKTLRNTLRAVVDPALLATAGERAGIDLGARAERLTASDLLRLDEALTELAADGQP